MNSTKRSPLNPGTVETVLGLSSVALSQGDYAHYIMEMSAELARIADAAKLPEMIGHTLRMASRAAQEKPESRN